MPFAAFQSTTLYHPSLGYYARPGRTGQAGHYVTAPELHPAFGELWCRGFEAIWESCGRPARFEVVEAGPGAGGFAAAVLGSATGGFAEALTMTLVEGMPGVAERQRERLGHHRGRVAWTPSVAEVTPVEAGCFFANEVLDNLPVHLVEQRDGALMEVCVDAQDGELELTLRPPASPELAGFVERCGVRLPEGHRLEIGLAAESFVSRAAALLARGALLLVDYGHSAADLAQRPGGTLASYSSAGADDNVLERPGAKDITSHANWTAVLGAMRRSGLRIWGPVPQRTVLEALGLHDRHRRAQSRADEARATGDGATFVRLLSERGALGALADPRGLGGLGVVAGWKSIRPPSWAAPRP